ncbi:MAG: cell division topological specificity factor MinE [Clostridiales bacterium]|nr:cell division topological specificity factor MinE [Clostridiales bacterium]MCF8022282.1 cell division topological specificity factor MinE [Clostridiales bacterium]
MLDFLAKIFNKDSSSSSNVAKERLQLVLVHDRSSISPELLQVLKTELIEVITNYMEIEEESLEVNLDNKDEQVALVANIPVKKMKRMNKSLSGS